MTTSKIPKIIHQVFFPIGEYPDKVWKIFRESREACIANHPDWEYRLWGPDNSRDLIVSHFPELLETYESLKYEIMRIDFIRYCFLYHYGGIYLDMDMYPLRNLEGLRNRKLLLHNIQHISPKFSWVENDVMGSVPKLGFWKTVITEIQQSIKEKDANSIYEVWRGRYILQTTGPYMLARVCKNYYPKFKPVRICLTKWDKSESCEFRPYLRDYKVGSWNNWEKVTGAKKNQNAFATETIEENKFSPELYKPIIP